MAGVRCLAILNLHVFGLGEGVSIVTRCYIPVAIRFGCLILWIDHMGFCELESLCCTFAVLNTAWWYVPPVIKVIGKLDGDIYNILYMCIHNITTN